MPTDILSSVDPLQTIKDSAKNSQKFLDDLIAATIAPFSRKLELMSVQATIENQQKIIEVLLDNQIGMEKELEALRATK